MSKPMTPKQAREAANPKDKRAHLKKLVARKLNRELRKGLRVVRVENNVSPELAQEVADEFAAAGWTVHTEDQRHTLIATAWVFTFSIMFEVGTEVVVDMIDRQAWPEVFPGKVIDTEPAGPREHRFLVEYQDSNSATQTMWLISRYLERRTA